jgi:medium-chain acyl-[acyl-carrier-protein] hydrolase
MDSLTPRLDPDPWIHRKSRTATPRLRLFCFPYAGGGAAVYRAWADALPDGVEVCAIRLPGRDLRLGEPPFRRVGDAAERIADALHRHLDLPYAIFGHSMGAVLGYEVARRIRSDTGLEPRRLLVSGHRAPHRPARRPPLHCLADDALIDAIRKLNGTPAEVFEHRELLALMLPLLRADFELVETWRELPGPRLSCPVTALGGDQDSGVPPEDLAAWHAVTDGPFTSVLFKGDHFFINTARDTVLDLLRRQLATF